MIFRLRNTRVMMAIALCLITTSLFACKLPVFRYALERWSVDRYRMVAVIDTAASEQVVAALAEMERIGDANANIDVETIDLSRLTEEQLWQVEGLENDAQTPLLQVYFPERDGKQKLCWSGELTREAVAIWPQSKLRQQIVADITSGVSAVWILVEGKDVQENARMADELRLALAKATAEITIPEGVIAREEANRYLQEHPGASMDDVLRSDIPLKIDFQMRRLELSNEEEPALRAIIAGWSNELEKDSGRTSVFPVFGRGRMIEPLSADRFSEESVVAACRYMVGECNCTLKALNPGVDLILDSDWRALMDDSLVIMDNPITTTPQIVAIPAGAQSPRAGSSDSIPKNPSTIAILVAGIITLIAIASWQTIIRSKRNRL